MKILCLSQSIGPGGAERQLTGLAVMLKNLGYEVIVITYSKNEFYIPLLVENGVEYKCIDKALSKIRRLPELFKTLKKYSPDVVISYEDGPNFVSCLSRIWGRKFKLIVSERNTNQNVKLTLRDIIKFNLYRKADYVVCNSFTQTNYIDNYFPVLAKKNLTITNFTDTNVFFPAKSINNENTIQCICVGRIVPQKNVHLFINAIGMLKEKGYLLKIRWYGNIVYSDPYSKICLDLIKENNLQEIFIFKRPTKKIQEEYQKSDLFCLPSLHEGYPNVLCEAMSSGLPVLCSNISDNPMLIETGVNGFIFDPKDKNEIVSSFIKFFSLSESDKKQIGIANRSKALSIFSKEVFLKKYLKLIDPLNNNLNNRMI